MAVDDQQDFDRGGGSPAAWLGLVVAFATLVLVLGSVALL